MVCIVCLDPGLFVPSLQPACSLIRCSQLVELAAMFALSTRCVLSPTCELMGIAILTEKSYAASLSASLGSEARCGCKCIDKVKILCFPGCRYSACMLIVFGALLVCIPTAFVDRNALHCRVL